MPERCGDQVAVSRIKVSARKAHLTPFSIFLSLSFYIKLLPVLLTTLYESS
jgi:hypothetical protein